MSNVRQSVLAVVATAVIAGCSGTVPGTAVTERADPAAVNPAALNTGSYPITPQPPLGNASTYDVGRLIEGRRMASYVVGPWQVDPSLTRAEATGASVIINRDRLGLVLWPPMMARTPLLPLIVGFVAERKAADTKDPTSLRNVVVRYADPAAAAAVAAGMATGALTMPVDTGVSTEPIPTEPIRPVPIPGHADVNGALLTRHDGTQVIQELVVASAHGPYVLVQDVQTVQDPDRAAALAGETLDLQGPLIDKFQPTDPGQFLTLPLDPTGLVARTLPIKPAQATTMSNAAYDPAAALQLEDDPIEAASALTEASADVVSVGQTTVYQTKDPDSARRLAQLLGDETAKSPGAAAVPAVPGLPQSRCIRIDDSGLVSRHWCITTVGRYAFKAAARQLDNSQQALAAQYRILTS